MAKKQLMHLVGRVFSGEGRPFLLLDQHVAGVTYVSSR